MDSDNADSPVIGIILIIALLFILFLILLLYLTGMLSGFYGQVTLAPPLIQVTSVLHYTPDGEMKLASRVAIMNTDTKEYKNRDLIAVFYRNKKKLYAVINTLHGEGFIPTQHFGVSTISGSGCKGEYFSPGEGILIDLKNGYYAPGNLVEMRVSPGQRG